MGEKSSLCASATVASVIRLPNVHMYIYLRMICVNIFIIIIYIYISNIDIYIYIRYIYIYIHMYICIIKGSLGGETSVLRTFRMSGKELVKERVSKERVRQGKS